MSDDNASWVSPLERDFEEWAEAGGSSLIWMGAVEGSGRCVALLANGEDEVKVTVPDNYPEAGDAFFFVETSAPRMVPIVAEVNAFVTGEAPGMAFINLLFFMSNALGGSGSGSDSDDSSSDSDSDAGSDLVFSDEDGGFNVMESELEELATKKRWKAKEAELRERKAKEEEEERRFLSQSHTTSTEHERKQKEVTQIFSSGAAYGILTNELLSIMKNKDQLGFDAEPVDDNVYHWRVRMFDFDPESRLGQELGEINQLYGYAEVEIEIHFVMDLFPFYPPRVSLVRPRFQVFMMNRITCMDMLKLEYWDPVKDMRSVLGDIRMMLQDHGQLDIAHPKNDRDQFADGAYTKVEHLLLKLELTSDKEARANKKYADQLIQVEKPRTGPSPSKRQKTGETSDAAAATTAATGSTTNSSQPGSGSTFWSKGTGYGSGSSGGSNWNVEAYLAAQAEKDNQLVRVLRDILDCLQTEAVDETTFVTLEESCLVPVLENALSNDSLLDMNRHAVLYAAVFQLVEKFASTEALVPLLDNLIEQKRSLQELLSTLNRMCQPVLSVAVHRNADTQLAERISSIYKMSKRAVARYRRANQITGTTSTADAVDGDDGPQLSAEDLYLQTMRPTQFDSMAMNIASHHYASHANESLRNETVLRCAQEQGGLATSLPCNLSSTIWFRVDEDKINYVKFMITGPEDTPYEHGCFQFDACFPQAYPDGPPLVNLETTGNGAVRFNPNLYNTGKVCLSLLGTWRGAAGENWDKQTSTFLQVMISISALILVPMPYFNEPGYESSIGTPQGEASNTAYNQNIQVQTLRYAILGQIRHPAHGFEDVIHAHFFLRKDAVLETMEEWIRWQTETSSPQLTELKGLVAELQTEFRELTMPDLSKYTVDSDSDSDSS